MSLTFAAVSRIGLGQRPSGPVVRPGAAAPPAQSTGAHDSTASAWVAAGAAIASVTVARGRRGRPARTPRQYTTEKILPKFEWLKTGFAGGDLQPGEFRVQNLAGCDVCVGKTQTGKLFAIGDKAPPTGLSFSLGAEVRGDSIVETQYGNAFNVFDGLPTGDWCPSPPIIGGLVGLFMGGPQAVAVFDVRESFFGGAVEVSVDTNARKAYEADYWKGLLDAQGKVDGTYY